MSIRPQFAAAILDGSKRVEFRKRPLAADIGTVVIYATKPVGAVLGEFVVDGQAVGKPEELWVRFARWPASTGRGSSTTTTARREPWGS